MSRQSTLASTPRSSHVSRLGATPGRQSASIIPETPANRRLFENAANRSTVRRSGRLAGSAPQYDLDGNLVRTPLARPPDAAQQSTVRRSQRVARSADVQTSVLGPRKRQLSHENGPHESPSARLTTANKRTRKSGPLAEVPEEGERNDTSSSGNRDNSDADDAPIWIRTARITSISTKLKSAVWRYFSREERNTQGTVSKTSALSR